MYFTKIIVLQSTAQNCDVVVNSPDTCDTKFLYEHFGNILREKRWKSETQVDVLHAKVQERQEDDNGLLLVPKNSLSTGIFLIFRMIHFEMYRVFLFPKFHCNGKGE